MRRLIDRLDPKQQGDNIEARIVVYRLMISGAGKCSAGGKLWERRAGVHGQITHIQEF